MTLETALHGASPAIGEVAGHPVVLHHGDIAAEYGAMRAGAVLVDRSARNRVRVEGPRAAELLTGLVTSDVLALTPGQGQYGAALGPKGKILADVRIFALADHLLVDTSPRAAPGWLATLRKYINPRQAPYRDISSATRHIGLFGPNSRRMLSLLTGIPADALGALAPYAHLPVEPVEAPVTLARVPDFGVEGYEMITPSEHYADLTLRLSGMGAMPAGLLVCEIARIECGRPEWGLDMDETTLVQEALLDTLHAVSYTKGCYVGQEVVARVHFRGHVNRLLRGLQAADGEPLPTGSRIVDESGKPLGDVRSSATSPRLGSIALAMVRREAEPGMAVMVEDEGSPIRAELVRLPFGG
ncbi:MAG: YgfZ/GcvT domain-containing protein [Gemmatimonadaceae bacterium]